MLIGLDFDNTIVRYDMVFHTVARERGLIDNAVAASKVAVRDDLRSRGLEEAWTEIQGYVYGCRMDLAEVYDGVFDFLRWARQDGHECVIISHKTRRPYLGPAYDLHAAASTWIKESLIDAAGPLVEEHRVFFRETKAEKIDQISAQGCNVYVDDLPEILLADNFPDQTRRILFDPDNHHADEQRLEIVQDWKSFKGLLGK